MKNLGIELNEMERKKQFLEIQIPFEGVALFITFEKPDMEKIRGYNSINFRMGYQMTEIRTPKEIFNYEDSKD
jgi:hypothetical protein